MGIMSKNATKEQKARKEQLFGLKLADNAIQTVTQDVKLDKEPVKTKKKGKVKADDDESTTENDMQKDEPKD